MVLSFPKMAALGLVTTLEVAPAANSTMPHLSSPLKEGELTKRIR